MKKTLTGLFSVVLLLAMAVPAMAQTANDGQQIRIGTVDLSRVFTNYWKFKQASAHLEEEKADLEKTDKEMLGNRQKLVEEYNRLKEESNNQALSSSERENRRKAAEDKLRQLSDLENNIKEFRQKANNRLTEQTLRMRENLLIEIRDAVRSRAKAGGFTLVFDSAAQSADRTPVILYGTAIDLTDAVLSQLNAAAPAGAK
ncbi:MAG TPA: OmpH family outer membrane protein [Verrucomicrobia bacterium]|nr:OmpH family outer membrane protein [Verrucomicrobiota bacterium]HOB32689.1 OmpH family outer membrane protein [Verrucomicrobiota bacterium]HOP98275.1 OmpH family outer membrane protein [Verrucomicrobiota bacterium]